MIQNEIQKTPLPNNANLSAADLRDADLYAANLTRTIRQIGRGLAGQNIKATAETE